MRSLIAILGVSLCGAAVVNKVDGVVYIFTEAPRYEPKAWLDGRDRFPAGAQIRYAGGAAVRAVVPGFYASADAAISFDGERVLFSGKRTARSSWQIWELPLTRGTPRQVSTGDSDCIRPFYLPEDFVVYTRVGRTESFLEKAPLAGGKPTRLTFATARVLTDDVLRDGRILFEAGAGARELFTVYPDGTGVEAVRCDHGADRGDARQVSSGDVIFSSGGRLAKFASSLAAQANVVQPPGEFVGAVAEIAAEQWFITMRAKSGRFSLYRWDSLTSQVTPANVGANLNAIEPVVVAPRTAPKRFPSALVTTRTAGTLLCLNSRVSRTPIPASADIRRVRVYTRNSLGAPAVLGETGVEDDGSFFIQVPADKPLRLELLDRAGGIVRSEHGWFWMRPSEQRICVGCHAGPERAPENKVPAVLLKTTDPVKMLEAK